MTADERKKLLDAAERGVKRQYDYDGGCFDIHDVYFSAAGDAELLARYVIDTLDKSPWQPIETAPKDGTAIIAASVLNGKVVHVRMGTWNGLGWYEVYSGAGINHVTHWMPLPEPCQPTRRRGERC